MRADNQSGRDVARASWKYPGNTRGFVLLGAIKQLSRHPYLDDNGFRFKMGGSQPKSRSHLVFQLSWIASCLVELVELSPRRVPLHDSIPSPLDGIRNNLPIAI